jgi:hypothetical protein
MSVDFAALAEAMVTGLPDVRACLIVSRDGLVLAAHPAAEESRGLGIWGRIAAMGDVERGFAVVGDELWSFCRRGAYSALATANPAARAGIIIDRLEQGLLVAEEDRARRESLRQAADRDPATQPEAVRRLRTALHRDPRPEPEETGPTDQQAADESSPWRVDAAALAREFHGLAEPKRPEGGEA